MGSSTESKSKVTNEEEEVYSHAMVLGSAIVLPTVFQAVVNLDVLDIIDKAGPGAELSASEIASQIPTKNPEGAAKMLDRVLGLLVSFNILCCSFSTYGVRLYSLAPVAKYYVTDQNGVSMRPYMNLSLDKVMMPGWFQLKDQILEGELSYNKALGMDFYDYLGTDSRFNEVFNNGMIGQTSFVINKIVESYKGFQNITRLVDVGGGLGITLTTIISKYPHIKGMEHVGGDMYQKIPEGDAILMKWMLHNFDDENCIKILRNCYKALPNDGKVLVINSTLPEVPDSTEASRDSFILDAIFLIQIPHGRERTKKEFTALAIEAGFKGINFECNVCNSYVMEFYK
ncbi:Flavone 3'-O-methyltransferase 1 [Citrus sinensis]|uniref:Flavone 3'-O-methyltransferase 1 n=1 Tax=Citrus sinensis TaxID=2711 RepID=A0ACB8HZ38_CITSI|nr:Flavone 3'-O-methyltransferase 1 [Citrus sinensis]